MGQILEDVNKCTYLFEGRKMPFNSKLDDQWSGHSHCALKKNHFCWKSSLPLTGLQTECLHGLATGLGCHTHSVHELPRFWYLQKVKNHNKLTSTIKKFEYKAWNIEILLSWCFSCYYDDY